MPRELAVVSAERLTLATVLQAAATVDDRLVPRGVLNGWAVQLVDLDDVAVLTVEQSRLLVRTDDIERIAGWSAPAGPLWWTEANAPWGRAGDHGIEVAYAIGERLRAGFVVSGDGSRPRHENQTRLQLRDLGQARPVRLGPVPVRVGRGRNERRGKDLNVVQHKILLDESELPTHWYNVLHDLPTPPPPVLHPGTGQPVGPEDLAPLFPMELIMQEVSTEQYVEIPEPVRDVYKLWRPSPLFRAHQLEAALGTPARIYYKYEGVSPAGSHKPNTSVPQAYYNAQAGIRRLTTETGAGQWGTALAFACAQYGLECEIWQVRASYDQKPYRRMMMETFGGTVHPSPSELTEAGRTILKEHPDSPGSLGIAISEAVEVAAQDPAVNYSLGSVLNHVLMHQTVIGEEALRQLALVGETPDLLVGCTGGGSNFGGLMFPFLREKWAGRMAPVVRAVEPTACPSLTQGVYAYDFGDTLGMTPLMKMHTLGHDFIPDPIHSGGLRYHGMSPLISHLYETGEIEAVAKPQSECFAAGVLFARTEGIVPAPEPTHALAAAVEEARRCAETGEGKVILTALCGHGHLDLPAYEAYLSGRVTDHEWGDADTQAALRDSLAKLPQLA